MRRKVAFGAVKREPSFTPVDRRPDGSARLRFLFPVIALISTTLGMAQGVVIHVPDDYGTIGEALVAAPDHAIVEIAGGEYPESVVVERPVTLRSENHEEVTLAATDDTPVIQVVDTEAVTIEGLTIVGGRYGIFVTRAQDVTIRNNVVSDSRLTGIKVRLGAADIVNNTVIDARSPYGLGIHVTNTMAWPESRVMGNTVSGHAGSGILTNMTGMITIHGNLVADNGRRGIAITEMSHARVSDNVVERNVETGIQVVDYSVAVVCNNTVVDTLMPDPSSSPRYGNGITIDFYSEVVLAHNLVRNSPQYGIGVLFGSLVELYRNDLIGNVALPVHVDGAQAFELDEHPLAAHGCGALPTESP